MNLDDRDSIRGMIEIPQSSKEAIAAFHDRKARLDLTLWVLNIVNEDHFSNGIRETFVSYMTQIEEGIDVFEAKIQENGPELDLEKLTTWYFIESLFVNAEKLGGEALVYAHEALSYSANKNLENNK